jgi:UDP-glucose 4-epimerase
VEALLLRGERVRVLDDLSSGRLENLAEALASGAVEWSEGSVCDGRLLREQLRDCSAVYHLAASVGVAMITAHPAECLRNNVEGVERLFEAVADEPVAPRVLLFSSSEVYGKSESVPLREDGDLVLGPSHISRWSYASGKVMGEFLALSEHRRSGVPVTVVRCFNTCGPRQRSSYGMVIPRLLDQALRGDPLTVYGDGLQTRCFSYVGDVVEQVLRLADHPGAVGQVFNIGADSETTVLELAERISALTGGRSLPQMVPYREVYGESFQDVRRRVPDLSKIRRVIGRLPFTDLDELLRRTLEARLRPEEEEPPAALPTLSRGLAGQAG